VGDIPRTVELDKPPKCVLYTPREVGEGGGVGEALMTFGVCSQVVDVEWIEFASLSPGAGGSGVGNELGGASAPVLTPMGSGVTAESAKWSGENFNLTYQ